MIVALAATAALGWIAFSRPVWRRPHPSVAPAHREHVD
jgi:4-amino-4-deoxy-L-arabinose transferase-like glycosyltransferase